MKVAGMHAVRLQNMRALCVPQDPDNLLTGEAQGYAAAQIFYDVFKVCAMFLPWNKPWGRVISPHA